MLRNVATDESGNQRSLFVLRGTPTCVLFYDGILLIPENLPDGWDVISYVVGAESQASPIMKDGEAFKGTGLKRVSLPRGLESLGAEAFDGTSITTLHLPASTRIEDNNLGTMKRLEEIIIFVIKMVLKSLYYS